MPCIAGRSNTFKGLEGTGQEQVDVHQEGPLSCAVGTSAHTCYSVRDTEEFITKNLSTVYHSLFTLQV